MVKWAYYVCKEVAALVSVYRYEEVTSTNDVAKAHAREGAREAVIIARSQTAGRGRLGRSFESPAGLGLYVSVLWRPLCSAEDLLPLTAMAAASAAMAIESVIGREVGIKWPNDLVLSGKKIAGLLTESALTSDGGVDFVVLGLGLNVHHTQDDFSPEVAAIASSLEAELGCAIDDAALESAVVEALLQTLRHLCAPETYLDEYRRRCVTVGNVCRLLPQNEEVQALDIDGRYGLVVRREGKTETIRSGEVSVRGLYGYV